MYTYTHTHTHIIHTQFSCSDLKTVAAQRINEGRLSITVTNQEWDTVVLSDVYDRRLLGQLHQQLQSIVNSTFPLSGVFSVHL